MELSHFWLVCDQFLYGELAQKSHELSRAELSSDASLLLSQKRTILTLLSECNLMTRTYYKLKEVGCLVGLKNGKVLKQPNNQFKLHI